MVNYRKCSVSEILVPYEQDVHTAEFRSKMELRLAQAYHEASQLGRKHKRSVSLLQRIARAAFYDNIATQVSIVFVLIISTNINCIESVIKLFYERQDSYR